MVERGFSSVWRSAEHGFTLIEMLVALAVFSLAALALLRLDAATIVNTGVLDDRTIGTIVARNVAVEALTDAEPPTLGTENGEEENAGRRWRWTRVTAALDDARLIRIMVSVTDERGNPAGSLTVIRRTG